MTRRDRDRANAYAAGYTAGTDYATGPWCYYRRPWLRAAWLRGLTAARRRVGGAP